MVLKVVHPQFGCEITIDDGTVSLEGSSVNGYTFFRMVLGDKTCFEDFQDIVDALNRLVGLSAHIVIEEMGINIEFTDIIVYGLWEVKKIEIFGKVNI